MRYSRIAAALAAAAIAGGGLAASGMSPASAATVLDHPRCKYGVRHVRTTLNVRATPGGRVVDKLYPGDHAWGSCRKFGKWRRVRGTENDRKGFAYVHYLKRLARR
ncbi:hypothetical protein GBF35_44115 [Nonomuraea phyllanthi]|uniref:hypothetical protein n=1 Tax=Nonomuraea phyllanthi TaxID=2219224 RepID=UPI001293F14E|nr:hypothetical protein [Nonomuraea phyllanthi]QFY12638.1 hypothetical protein GBF35_44115 [Nonomuraea phyllanthi]